MQSTLPGNRTFPLLIAQVDSPQLENTGDFYYRTYAPGIGMAQCEDAYTLSCTNVHRLKYEVMRESDVLIVNNLCDPDILPVVRNRKDSGKLTVYELSDDLNDIPPSNPVRGFYSQAKNLLLIKRLANYCDALQFSSPELQKKFGYLNSVSEVFPNQMLEIPPARDSNPSKMLTVGWGGSLGHLQDMERISGPLIDWIMSRKDVRLHLMCAESIRALFDRLPAERITTFETGSLQDYYKFVSQLDIGLAPLEDIAFNRSRSDVKFLEYAAHAVVPVVQAVGPYLESVRHGKTGFLFSSTKDLISLLDKLASDISLVNGVAAEAHAYVLRERNQLDRGQDRVDFYRRLLAGKNRQPWQDGRVEDTFNRLCDWEGARRTGRNLSLSPTRYELLLTGGLIALEVDKSKARRMFQEAITINSALYMPYLLGSFVADDAVQSLKNALEKNAESIASWLCLGSVYRSKGMSPEAIDCFNSAAGIFPEYEQPYIECANYLNMIGMKQEGTDLLKKAISLIPEAIRNPQG
jgi:tetratricopeptide (TPR) repeat protein